nr:MULTISPECIES: medium chain dehydrogenase/reductase family protein [unclassified Saccharopolyspora]
MTTTAITGRELVLTGLGAPQDVLTSRETEHAAPGAGRVLVRVEAAGLSFAEVQMLGGRYPMQPAFPFVPGYDLVGEVVATGPGVTTCRPGQRVAAMTRTGAWAEHVELAAELAVVLPAQVPADEAVALVTNGVTAWQLLHRSARVPRGGTVLVHGAGGGVGSTLLQLCRLAGVRAIGTASGHRHERLAGLGAELVDHRTEDVGRRVRELAPSGVDAVFDPLGPDSLTRSWELLAPGGRLISYGSAGTLDDAGSWWKPYADVALRIARWEALRLLGRAGGRRARMYYVRADGRYRDDLAGLLRMLADGELHPLISHRLPLRDAARALDLHRSGKSTGKIVLLP